jgi:hypothetical protein
MTYPIALRVFAFALALICIGLMALVALVAHYLPTSGTLARLPSAIQVPAPHWPDLMLRGGTVCLLVAFVVLIATCCMIASV